MKKSLCFAYILLVFGGWAGLHLLYLKRDKQAFIYWCTFGGYFGLAPLRDLYRLPTYVKDANDNQKYLAHLSNIMKKNNKPPFSLIRVVSQILIGNSWCFLYIAAVPNDPIFGISFRLLKFLGPLAAALGVWLIGNIGREKGNMLWPLIGAYSILPFTLFNFHTINWSCISSTILFQWKAKEWRRNPYIKRSVWKRFMHLSMGWTLFCSLWISYIYFNAEIKSKDGEKAKVKDAIHNFFKSPMFIEFKKNAWQLLEDAKEHGWAQAWNNLIELLDPLGEQHALKILNLQKGASQEEISARFKTLSKEWHPDRHKDPDKKIIAQERFVEIAEAYEKLSSLKQRRRMKNKQNEEYFDENEEYSDAGEQAYH